MFPNKNKINNLRIKIIDELIPLINTDYVLLDVPNHRNIGDNLIWEGELEFLKIIPYRKLYSSNFVTCLFSKIPDHSIILLHGGGNFGDIYPDSQKFKLEIISNFPNNRIIIFPQTVFYNDETILQKESKQFNLHKDLIICVRDNESYKRLTKYVDKSKVKLLPDMAFFLNLEKFQKFNVSQNILYMKRIDKEFNVKFSEADIFNYLELELNKKNYNLDVLDWPSYKMKKLHNFILYKLDNLEYMTSRYLVKNKYLNFLIDDDYGLKSKSNRQYYIDLGITFLNNYDLIFTTRLHGFILAILLNKKVVFIDNSYGKNSSFYYTWMTEFENVELLK
jgi:pyruvyl transferase EpsO